ncbi:hypothetical protein BN164_1170071 [Clostridioides difficile T20]|nr:hypothetical protein BN164_1170071 [Clostridioides difficile T20]CCK98783.1 hypothetical protein BN166_1590021 [Clostridioides difficile E10]
MKINKLFLVFFYLFFKIKIKKGGHCKVIKIWGGFKLWKITKDWHTTVQSIKLFLYLL